MPYIASYCLQLIITVNSYCTAKYNKFYKLLYRIVIICYLSFMSSNAPSNFITKPIFYNYNCTKLLFLKIKKLIDTFNLWRYIN